MTVEPKSEAVHAAFVVTLATRLVLVFSDPRPAVRSANQHRRGCRGAF